ncbi:MAG: DNA polymerase III subunit gamma/tau, partial [Rubricoccaceae bacterium]
MTDAPRDTPDAPATRYVVTARKYRPQTFGDLVAQEHVAQTLRNAILGGRLAHAYLFSGPRGVGKTTAARVLAKAINCQTPLAERPDAEPCRTCEACRSFEEGRALNVIELDAASNNSVNDVRELRDTVRVPPQGAAKKVYILDEVHMLSASAFNALLKTLEEPPPYVVFIFATTEPHKVLPTILSRTQRFDFRRIQVPEIVGRLRAICAAEGVRADDEALVLLARKGDGALRDALSLFDQAVAICGQDLQGAALREALGVVATDLFFDVTDAAAAGDRAGVLALVDALVRRGYDLREFLHGLAEHLRDLLAARTTGHADLIEATEQTRARYLEAAGAWAEADLLHLLMLTDEAALAMRDSRQPRLTLELALLKMTSLERAADLRELLARLERFEAAVRSGAPAGRAPGAPPAARPEAPPDARPTPERAAPGTPGPSGPA